MKANENISFKDLVDKDISLNFNMMVLRFLIGFYRMGGVIMRNAACASVFFPSNAVVAGCSFADLCMRIILTPILDTLALRYERVMAAVVVDDIHIHYVGALAGTAKNLTGAFALISSELQAAKLQLSDKKLVLTCSSTDLSEAVQKRQPRLRQKNPDKHAQPRH